MTIHEKEKIKKLRQKGLGYKKIAKILDINISTIRSYCLREETHCLHCKKLTDNRKFCSVECKSKWWNKNRSSHKKTSAKKIICLNCKKEFFAYEKENRKYCSHTCYITSRFKGEDRDE